jgi:acyl-CoA thioesterase-1
MPQTDWRPEIETLMPKVVLRALLFNCLVLWLALPAAAADAGRSLKIVAFGDSLTAGYRLRPAESFPRQLEHALRARGQAVEVINAGVSGDTTAAGLERLPWAVVDGTDAVILEFGANDALRGLSVTAARDNLDKILAALGERKIPVLLAGMVAPRGLGPDYVAAFDAMYAELAKKHGAALYPFFLDGIALKPELNLDDGVHPNAKGVGVIVERILPAVERLIKQAQARAPVATKG